MLKKIVTIISLMLLITLSAPCFASANSPPPDTSVDIRVENASDELAYIDILVDKTHEGIDTSAIQSAFLEKYPQLADTELAGYESDGYVSYSLYYGGNSADPSLSMVPDVNGACSFNGGNWSQYFNTFKIAALDQDGKIIQVSDPVKFPSDYYNRNGIYTTYDFAANKATVNPGSLNYGGYQIFAWVFVVIFALLRIVFSTLLEFLIALPFKSIRPLWLIWAVNAVTQIIITVGIPLLATAVSYVLAVIVFEAFVYVAEFRAYWKWMPKSSWKTALAYTLIANTASLLLGLAGNALGIFRV